MLCNNLYTSEVVYMCKLILGFLILKFWGNCTLLTNYYKTFSYTPLKVFFLYFWGGWEGSENNLWEMVLSLHHVGSEYQTWVPKWQISLPAELSPWLSTLALICEEEERDSKRGNTQGRI